MSNAQEEQIRDYVSTLREMNRHEDGLLSQRLTWMWTLQGLLFGGASLLWGRDWRSVVLIGCIGLLSCLSIGYSMARGLRAMHEFRALDDIQRESLPEGSILAPAIGAVGARLAYTRKAP